MEESSHEVLPTAFARATRCARARPADCPVSDAGSAGGDRALPDLLGLTATESRVAGTGTHTDFTRPSLLVYFPDETGDLHLGAIENLVFRQGWEEAGNSGRPEFHGHDYWALTDNPATADVDEAHMFEPHYELHLWIHEENPLGPTFPFNPNVSCTGHDGPTTMAEGMEWAKANAPPAAGP